MSPLLTLPRSFIPRTSFTGPVPKPGEAPSPFAMGGSSTACSTLSFARKVTALVWTRKTSPPLSIVHSKS